MSRPWKPAATDCGLFVNTLVGAAGLDGLPVARWRWDKDPCGTTALVIDWERDGRLVQVFFAPRADAGGHPRWTLITRNGGPSQVILCRRRNVLPQIRVAFAWLLGGEEVKPQ